MSAEGEGMSNFKTPEILRHAFRQYCPADRSLGIAVGFDWQETVNIVTAMQQRIAALEKVAEAAYEEERTKLDANQYATEQARVAKLAGLREVGYWEPNPPRPSPPLAPPAQSPEAGKTAD